MKLLRRPNAPGVSKEKLGAASALATVLGWVIARWAGVDVPEEVLLAAATAILALVQWRARDRRGTEDRPVRAAKLR